MSRLMYENLESAGEDYTLVNDSSKFKFFQKSLKVNFCLVLSNNGWCRAKNHFEYKLSVSYNYWM